MKLVIFDMDWADEFNAFGFAVMTDAEFKAFSDHYSKPRSWGFGTNEGFEDEVALSGCTVKDITDAEAETLKKLFELRGDTDWAWSDRGQFPSKPDPDDEDDKD